MDADKNWSVILVSRDGSGQVSRHSLPADAVSHRDALLERWPGKTYLIKLDDTELRDEILGGDARYQTVQLLDGWAVRDVLSGALMAAGLPDQAEADTRIERLQKLDELARSY